MPEFDVFSNIIMGLSTASAAYSQSQAEKAQGEYQTVMFEINARMAEFQAGGAIERGDWESLMVLRKGKRLAFAVRRAGRRTVGEQKAAFAAQGIQIDSGSAGDIVTETELASEIDQIEIRRAAEIDALTIKNNAWREAWGYKEQASQYGTASALTSSAASTRARNTLLTGGMQALAFSANAYGAHTRNAPVTKTKTSSVKPKFSVRNNFRKSFESGPSFNPGVF